MIREICEGKRSQLLLNFKKYQCLYCEFWIKSVKSLSEHRTVCKNVGGRDLVKNVNLNVKSKKQNPMDMVQSCLLQLQARDSRVLHCNICHESCE